MTTDRWIVACVLFGGLWSAATNAAPLVADPTARGLISEINVPSEWAAIEGPIDYDADDLFEYLNGGAPQYIAYGFTALTHVRYAFLDDELSSVTLDVYDMKNPLAAYGIYSSGRRRDVEPRQWGVEGYQAGTIAAAWQGRYYVHASADNDRPALLMMMRMIMDRVTVAIPGPREPPELLVNLPTDGLIPRSDRYVAKDLFGHAFLPGGLLASYDLGRQEMLLFLVDLGGADAAQDALARWKAYEEKRGKILPEENRFGDGGFWAQDPGLGKGCVVRSSKWLVGAWEVVEEISARDLVRSAINRLNN